MHPLALLGGLLGVGMRGQKETFGSGGRASSLMASRISLIVLILSAAFMPPPNYSPKTILP